MTDLKYAFRQLLKNPGFATVAILTLALGIGANTAIFSVVNGVLLRPLPYREPEQLLRIFQSSAGQPKFPMSAGDFQDYRAQNSTLDGLALYTRQDLELSMDDKPELLSALRVTSGFFEVLGTRPMLGREFNRQDEAPDNLHSVILSHGLWQPRFHSDLAILGRPVTLSGETYTIVGVMPPGVQHVGGDYRSMPHGETVDFWWPVTLKAQDERTSHYMNAVGRMKPGTRLSDVIADFNVIADRLARDYPAIDQGWRIAIQPLREEIVGRSRTMLWVLFSAVVFVLLIACVNVANLLLARASKREREMAVRVAVGAGRWRIVRQMLTECMLLAALGSVLGIILAKWAVDALTKLASEQLPRLQTVSVDFRILLFSIGLTFLTGLLFGLVPALQAGRTDVNGLLNEGGRGGLGTRQRRLRDILVAAEVGLALLLLVGTGLLVRSFWRLQQVSPGFNPERILTAVISLPNANYGNRTNVAEFEQQLLDRLAARPGVQSVGLTSDLPWTGYDENNSFVIEGRAPSPDDEPGGRYHFVSANYFRTIGVPLVGGRFFDSGDRLGKLHVMLVNQSLAKRYWPKDNAIGNRIAFYPNAKEEDWWTIVGIVGDVKDLPTSPSAIPAFYLPLLQRPMRQATLALKTSAEPVAMTAIVREELQRLDKSVPLANVRTLESVTAAAGAGRRFTLWLVACFAATALGLAAIGIYGVLSYLVAQRTREIGIRMALGAQARDVIALTFKQGMRPALIGVALGLVGAFALTRLMSSLLFGVSATDPGTFAASATLLVAVALLPCWIPARRAAKVDPMIALRND